MKLVSSSITDAVQSQLLNFGLQGLVAIFCVTGAVQVLSEITAPHDSWHNNEKPVPLQFHDALYFVFTTFATIGYGDISPEHATGRLFMVGVIIIVMIQVPIEIQKVTELISLWPTFGGKVSKYFAAEHVIICCNYSCGVVVESFLQEFFHPDHGIQSKNVVLVLPADPDLGWKAKLLKYTSSERLTFLQGDLRNKQDLMRARAERASAIFLLVDPHDKNLDNQEFVVFMRFLACHDYCRDCKKEDIKVFAQVFNTDTIEKIKIMGLPVELLLCLDSIRKRMLAGACLWQGVSTLLRNLVSSTSDPEETDETWLNDYANGLSKEIYAIKIDNYSSWSLKDLTLKIFNEHGAIVFAVTRNNQLHLYPGRDFMVQDGDAALIIADNQSVADEISSAQRPQVPLHSNTSAAAAPQGQFTIGGVKSERKNIFEDTVLSCLMPQARPRPQPRSNVHAKKTRIIPSFSGFVSQKKSNSEDLRSVQNVCGVLDGPVVIITPSLYQVDCLLEYLFSDHLEFILPGKEIVIVCPSLKEEHEIEKTVMLRHQHKQKMRFIDLPPKKEFLEFANVHIASMVLILADQEAERALIDSRTLAIYVEVQAIVSKNTRVIVELFDANFMDQIAILSKFKLSAGEPRSNLQRAPTYFSMRTSADKLDHTTAKAKSWHEDWRTLLQFQSKEKKEPSKPQSEHVMSLLYNHAYVGGDAVLGTFSGLLLCQAYFNPHILKVIAALLSSSKCPPGIPGTVFLVQVSLPDQFFDEMEKKSIELVDATDFNGGVAVLFRDFFQYLLEEYDAVPVGLFRPAPEKQRAKERPGHVIACPNGNMKVHSNDKVFVLARVDVHESQLQVDDYEKGEQEPLIFGKEHFHIARGDSHIQQKMKLKNDLSNIRYCPPEHENEESKQELKSTALNSSVHKQESKERSEVVPESKERSRDVSYSQRKSVLHAAAFILDKNERHTDTPQTPSAELDVVVKKLDKMQENIGQLQNLCSNQLQSLQNRVDELEVNEQGYATVVATPSRFFCSF